MAVQPYDDCPCGSGKKFRWCCQKAAKYGDRAEQMLEKGQVAGALQTLDEGLAADPENMWLRLTKLQVLLEMHNHEAAQPLIESVLAAQPGNRRVLMLRMHHEMAHGAVDEALATLQDILDAPGSGTDGRQEAAAYMIVVGQRLADEDVVLPALALFRTAISMDEQLRTGVDPTVASLERRGDAFPWIRDEWKLRAAPDDGTGYRERWNNAVALAANGRWRCAATLFQLITSEQPSSANAWFNLGLCQAWLAGQEAAPSLERYAQLESDRERAVHALALAQCVDIRLSEQTVDVVQVTYTIRDHSRLIQRLKDHPRFSTAMLDAKEGELGPGVKDEFYLLDKDRIDSLESITPETLDRVPSIAGRVQTVGKHLRLEFAEPVEGDNRPTVTVEAAGETIDPNGTRSVVAQVPLSSYRLGRQKALPSGGSRSAVQQYRKWMHQGERRDIWLNTPMGWLGNRTPIDASKIAELKPALRAAVLCEEYLCELQFLSLDGYDLRTPLGLEPETTIDGEAVDIEQLPIASLRLVRAEQLATPQVVVLFNRALKFALPIASARASLALASRLQEHDQFEPDVVFHRLIDHAKSREDRSSAERWLQEARRFTAERKVGSNEWQWDLEEWEISLRFDPVHDWAPRLAQLLKKLESHKEAASSLMMVLVRAGILRLVPDPSKEGRMVIDARILEQILARYGTPQGGMLDLSTVGGEPGKIWTPGAEAPGGDSSIVLPGQAAPSKARSKLVIPG